MKDFEIDVDAFQAEVKDNIVCLRFKPNFLLRTRHLDNRDQVISYLDRVGKSDRIAVLMIIGSPDSRGRKEFVDFFENARSSPTGMISIHRMYNVISQLVVKIVGLNKFVMHVNSGYVITPYLNLSLACDYRILADNAVIQNPCIDLGMAPKGGGGFFLPQMLGRSRAYDIMLSTRDISADEAMTLGLVDEVVPLRDLDRFSLDRARVYGAKPMQTLSGVKQLINYNLQKDLHNYMEHENEVLLHIIKKYAS